MSTSTPRSLLEYSYEKAAEDYLRSLPLEHFMESTPQATQRKVTLESLDLVHAQRPEVQVFNELLVQYPRERGKRIGQVVPDNMIVISSKPIEAVGSYNIPLQPEPPFWVLEYVSKYNKRKDYEQSFQKYEKELKVPYCLMFYPDSQDVSLFHRGKTKYRSVSANERGRFAVPELEIEVAILEDWVRFWFRGELLPLPADLLSQLGRVRAELQEANRRAAQAENRANEERQARLAAEQELAQLRAQIEQRRGTQK